ncbi:Fis family transcriptional regulator [Rhodococcus sp. WB1]|uniref:Fis family transcriptional regulator n=2 Tax=Rhodococcus aetherivorans TaxID=191292 RepID=A0A059MMR3_9NOCA|nr:MULTISPECIES: helix-turn-helix domain-containing protein [Rhodococcus]NCL73346.1 Acetoin dehydrogenase operon transcriptional activator AcoR [Rhodococcus sp. YH1]ANZ24357.1 Fis family transcriptional regulator [Rhodococcus sp. WB1]KDE12277.1 Fis family transcriptional regulator [Rhodococcus aetherivorans]MBC2588544.1 Fis family transcriptional regulator [Rhodococcus aetherivorans]MDV6293919.1 helix-turn-helix domain-containing protein [Rhodococcus aetherivorans]
MNGLRPEIALSWKRSQLSGIDPGRLPEPTLLGPSDAAGRLLDAARPVLDELRTQLAGTGCCILLVDRDCRIVARLFDAAPMQRAMEEIGVVPGATLSEDTYGTNALGTPFEVRQSLVVHGEEHYLESLKDFSCYGHPLVHPVTRRIEGILDITAAGKIANPLFVPFLARAARDIEARLLEGARESDRRVVDAFQRAAQQRGVAVAAMGEDIMLTNKAAVELLVPADHAALRAIAVDLPAGESRTMDFALSAGGRTRLRIDRIPGIGSGALFLLDAAAAREPVPRSDVAQDATTRLRQRLGRLRERTGGVAILGEPGSGRTWAARELVRDTVTFLDAARIVGEGEHEWAAGLLSVAAAADGGVVVVEHVHLAPDPVLALLSSMLSDPAAARLVLTADPLDDVRPTVRELLARCPGQVRVPALRQRIRELGDLASALARELDRPDLRLGPSALTALSERSWPGNLAELRAVLAAIPERESPLPVRVEDLPVEYRATSRVSRLGGRERAEREAIIEALRESGGNKVHAAARLGISRTTLYSRIRALGIAG